MTSCSNSQTKNNSAANPLNMYFVLQPPRKKMSPNCVYRATTTDDDGLNDGRTDDDGRTDGRRMDAKDAARKSMHFWSLWGSCFYLVIAV